MSAALVRNDADGLEVRCFRNPADATRVSSAREWRAPADLAPAKLSRVEVRRHPSGGWTLAEHLAGTATARVYRGWFPSKSAARAALHSFHHEP